MQNGRVNNCMMGMMMCISMEMCSRWRARKAECPSSCPVEK